MAWHKRAALFAVIFIIVVIPGKGAGGVGDEPGSQPGLISKEPKGTGIE